jgi:hypothetical protein
MARSDPDFFLKPWQMIVIRLRIAKGWRYRFSVGFWLMRLGCSLVSSRVTVSVTGIDPGDSEPNVETSESGLEKLRRAASATPAAEIRDRADLIRNVTGHSLESMGLDRLEWRGPGGAIEPLTGLIIRPGQSIEEALRDAVTLRGEGWSVWFVTPAPGS